MQSSFLRLLSMSLHLSFQSLNSQLLRIIAKLSSTCQTFGINAQGFQLVLLPKTVYELMLLIYTNIYTIESVSCFIRSYLLVDPIIVR